MKGYILLIFLFLVEITAPPSSSVRSKKYDVFLNFRGYDVRKGFLSHLEKALLDQGFEAFVDDQLKRGKEIEDSLLVKIEQSYIAIVIFSQNYAHSEYCLNELLKIAECRQTTGQTVIPVFYHVDPSHVQDLTGNYEMAQLRKMNESLAEKWGNALKYTANLSGLVSSNLSNESQLIEEIIKHVLQTLNRLCRRDSARDGGLVGIDSRVEKIMPLLDGPEDVSVVGIWGEPGIGKTTLALATYDRMSCQFDYSCFFRELCEKFTAIASQNEVHPQCFRISDSRMSRKKLSREKVILAFDDVSKLSQVKFIMHYKDYMGSRSRIIVTSRDMRLLKKLDAEIHAVEKLHHHEALQLFSLHAFGKKVPEEGYLELSERVVKCAQGLPLALEVLGWNLFDKSFEEWEYELGKFSNDGLPNLEKEKMQDIASCFRRRTYFYESLVEQWGNALKGTASLSGLVSSSFKEKEDGRLYPGQSPSNFIRLSRFFFQFCSRYKLNNLALRAIAFLFIIFLFYVKITASSSSVCNKKYNVFLSFRGSDVRQGFLSHLHKALLDNGIDAFVDDQLERGEDISESLLEKVEQSHIAIVIFSQNYAHSERCLEEMLKVAECTQSNGQVAIPVFYGVDPSHVQDLTGSYGDAMAQLQTKFDEPLVEKWGNALKDTASLSGLVSSSFRTESRLIEEIITHSLKTLDAARHGGLVGIYSLMEKVMSLLRGGNVGD